MYERDEGRKRRVMHWTRRLGKSMDEKEGLKQYRRRGAVKTGKEAD